MNENRERFKRIAETRTNKLIDMIELLGNCSNRNNYEYTEEDFLKYAIPLIKDQSGCRFLQEKIKTEKSFMEDKLFPSIKDNLFELGCDAFGNYFLQALIDIFSIENLNLFLSKMEELKDGKMAIIES